MKFLILLIVFFLHLEGSSFNLSQGNILNTDTKKESKISYNEMIRYMIQSNDPSQLFGVGVIYMNGIEDKDDSGLSISVDLEKALYYFNTSINKGYKKGNAIVGAFYLYNKNLSKISNSENSAEIYLKKAIAANDISAYIYLSDLYNRQDKVEESINVLMLGANQNDATAQLMVAYMYNNGVYNEKSKKQLIYKNEKNALFFLNKACSNKNKSEKVKKTCFNSKEVIVESKFPEEVK